MVHKAKSRTPPPPLTPKSVTGEAATEAKAAEGHYDAKHVSSSVQLGKRREPEATLPTLLGFCTGQRKIIAIGLLIGR